MAQNDIKVLQEQADGSLKETLLTPPVIGAVGEAPADGKPYARKDAAWAEVLDGKFDIKTESFVAEAGKSYACDTSAFTLSEATPSELILGGLKVLNTSERATTFYISAGYSAVYPYDWPPTEVEMYIPFGQATLDDVAGKFSSLGFATEILSGYNGTDTAADFSGTHTIQAGGAPSPVYTPFEVTTPQNPQIGDEFTLVDATGAWMFNAATIKPNNGDLVEGEYSNFAISDSSIIVYVGGDVGWKVAGSGAGRALLFHAHQSGDFGSAVEPFSTEDIEWTAITDVAGVFTGKTYTIPQGADGKFLISCAVLLTASQHQSQTAEYATMTVNISDGADSRHCHATAVDNSLVQCSFCGMFDLQGGDTVKIQIMSPTALMKTGSNDGNSWFTIEKL